MGSDFDYHLSSYDLGEANANDALRGEDCMRLRVGAYEVVIEIVIPNPFYHHLYKAAYVKQSDPLFEPERRIWIENESVDAFTLCQSGF